MSGGHPSVDGEASPAAHILDAQEARRVQDGREYPDEDMYRLKEVNARMIRDRIKMRMEQLKGAARRLESVNNLPLEMLSQSSINDLFHNVVNAPVAVLLQRPEKDV